MPEPTTQQEREARLYVTCHECNNCGHIGINDTSDTTSACNTCNWEGPEPKEDKCPGCQREGTMTTACPECGSRYHLLAEARISPRALPPTDAVDKLQQLQGSSVDKTEEMQATDEARVRELRNALRGLLRAYKGQVPLGTALDRADAALARQEGTK